MNVLLTFIAKMLTCHISFNTSSNKKTQISLYCNERQCRFTWNTSAFGFLSGFQTLIALQRACITDTLSVNQSSRALTHLWHGGLEDPRQVVLLMAERGIDQQGGLGHVWVVMLLQRLEEEPSQRVSVPLWVWVGVCMFGEGHMINTPSPPTGCCPAPDTGRGRPGLPGRGRLRALDTTDIQSHVSSLYGT